LSNYTSPKGVQCLLQLGSNFSLSPIDTRKDYFEVIKITDIRNKTIFILNNLTSNQSKHNHYNMRMLHLRKLANEFIKNNPQIKRHGSVSRQVHTKRTVYLYARPKVETSQDYQVLITAELIELIISSIDSAYPNYILKVYFFLLYVL